MSLFSLLFLVVAMTVDVIRGDNDLAICLSLDHVYALCTLLPQRLLAFSYSKCRETTMPVLSDNNGQLLIVGFFVSPIPCVPLYLITNVSWKREAI